MKLEMKWKRSGHVTATTISAVARI